MQDLCSSYLKQVHIPWDDQHEDDKKYVINTLETEYGTGWSYKWMVEKMCKLMGHRRDAARSMVRRMHFLNSLSMDNVVLIIYDDFQDVCKQTTTLSRWILSGFISPLDKWKQGAIFVYSDASDLLEVKICIWDPGEGYPCGDAFVYGMTRMRGGAELTARWYILGRCGIKPEGLEPFAGSDRRNVARRVLAQMQATDGHWIPPRQGRLQEDAERVRWTRHHTRQPGTRSHNRGCTTTRRYRAESEGQQTTKVQGEICRYEKNSNAGTGYVWPMCFPS
ncbi:hypothetical protein GOP47_0010403 [Adiantum capillus-veneris]|uniref:Uncharacterized protein n=1 Tax=Adiantum capillus-veneris TaxID=13818 RepID=A0A9D4UVX7_ADICA|nr:hypothetical protein GOP47_0010403 [Adiantum capillus-veneris]